MAEEMKNAENHAEGCPKPPKRRWGDRYDGRRVRSISAMQRAMAYFMPTRNVSTNYYADDIETTAIDQYIREKKAQGKKGFNITHVFIASYVRAVSQMPAANRFIAGQEIYARNDIVVSMVIKKEMSLSSPDTTVKAHYQPDATADEIYEELNRLIEDYRNTPGGGFDKAAKFLAHLPGFVYRFAVGLLRGLDYFGLMPKALIEVSPFHASFFVTSMGSLGIPPIFHHLYDFGNVPLFLSFGTREYRNVLASDGTVKRTPFVRYTFVMDERITDGYYYAAALKLMQRYYKNPWLLDERPETVVLDG